MRMAVELQAGVWKQPVRPRVCSREEGSLTRSSLYTLSRSSAGRLSNDGTVDSGTVVSRAIIDILRWMLESLLVTVEVVVAMMSN
jgi:hypothetical protein